MTPEEQIDAVVRAVLEQAGAEMVADAQQRLSVAAPPSSAPGEAPHRRSGTLRDGITFAVEQAGPTTTLAVASAAPYSAALEYGTARVAARPFLSPLRDDWSPRISQRLADAFG